MSKKESNKVVVSNEEIPTTMLDGIIRHYNQAKEKHPYFADKISTYYYGPNYLREKRSELRKAVKSGSVSAIDDVFMCEIGEFFMEIENENLYAAKEELLDAVAVLLRVYDVLDGRQALGNPEGKKV